MNTNEKERRQSLAQTETHEQAEGEASECDNTVTRVSADINDTFFSDMKYILM